MRAYERERCSLVPDCPTIISECSTPKAETGAIVDGIISTTGRNDDAGIFMTTSVLECKARWFPEWKLEAVYDNRILLTKSKMDFGYRLSRDLRVEFWYMTILPSCENGKKPCYYVLRLSDAAGSWIPDFNIKTILVKKSANSSDMVEEESAFIDMTTAHRYEIG
jgi:hypothetical protein